MVAFSEHRKNQHLADHFHTHHPSLSSDGGQSSTDGVPPHHSMTGDPYSKAHPTSMKGSLSEMNGFTALGAG